MIEFFIKTWSCAICGYKQDCEPTQENANQHFNLDKSFPVNDLSANECPSCVLKGFRGKRLEKETEPTRKMKMSVSEEADILRLKADLESEVDVKIQDGEENRLETEIEKITRIEKTVKNHDKSGLSAQEQKDLKSSLLSLPPLVRRFPAFRNELPEEKKIRVIQTLKTVKIASPDEITELRSKYEDVA